MIQWFYEGLGSKDLGTVDNSETSLLLAKVGFSALDSFSLPVS